MTRQSTKRPSVVHGLDLPPLRVGRSASDLCAEEVSMEWEGKRRSSWLSGRHTWNSIRSSSKSFTVMSNAAQFALSVFSVLSEAVSKVGKKVGHWFAEVGSSVDVHLHSEAPRGSQRRSSRASTSRSSRFSQASAMQDLSSLHLFGASQSSRPSHMVDETSQTIDQDGLAHQSRGPRPSTTWTSFFFASEYSLENPPPKWRKLCWELVIQDWFETAVHYIIVPNTLLLFIEVNWPPNAVVFDVAFSFLGALFVVELVVRLGGNIAHVEDFSAWARPSDIFVALIVIAEIVLLFFQKFGDLCKESSTNAYLCIVSLKLLRVARAAKLSRFLDSSAARPLVTAVSGAAESFFGILVFIGVQWLLFSVVAASFTSMNMEHDAHEHDACEDGMGCLRGYFETVPLSFLTCIKATFGGIQVFDEIVRPLLNGDHPWKRIASAFFLLFYFYSKEFLISLAMSVFTRQLMINRGSSHQGKFMKVGCMHNQADRIRQTANTERLLWEVQLMLVEADANGDGFLTHHELKNFLFQEVTDTWPPQHVVRKEFVRLQAELEAYTDLDLTSLVDFHAALDERGRDKVHIDSITLGVARLLGTSPIQSATTASVMQNVVDTCTDLRDNVLNDIGCSKSSMSWCLSPWPRSSRKAPVSQRSPFEQGASLWEVVPVPVTECIDMVIDRMTEMHGTLLNVNRFIEQTKVELLKDICAETERRDTIDRKVKDERVIHFLLREQNIKNARQGISLHVDSLCRKATEFRTSNDRRKFYSGSKRHVRAMRGLVWRKLHTDLGPWVKAEYGKVVEAQRRLMRHDTLSNAPYQEAKHVLTELRRSREKDLLPKTRSMLRQLKSSSSCFGEKSDCVELAAEDVKVSSPSCFGEKSGRMDSTAKDAEVSF
eukprot:TRINITY_DN21883_c0_g1_i1.p1 TRINITY_DN21883_c0_g1~~TRINITY_DN21883_c0_g1_i1.p1  ORF type:complete len:886 (+),score=130.31 TRINITY_DN21883_c0_g1_i1:134-2791(+)